jgi:hypothetical protein
MMKHHTYKYSILLFIIFCGYGCEKYIGYNAPEFRQKLVISSFISPSDTVSIIYVTSNQPLYTWVDHVEETGDVKGTISDGTTELQLDTTSSGLSFRSEKMPIIPGKKYTLNISSSKGLNAKAVATVPQEHDFMINIDTFSILNNEMPGQEHYEFRINTIFTDCPYEKNYYSITGRFTGYKTDTGSETETYINWLSFEKTFLTDLKTDSDNKIILDTRFSMSYHYLDSAFISVYLVNTEESYYLYHTSLQQFEKSDNPFSEVKPVYSNIEGGLGIFTSYTLDSLRFRLK